MPKPKKETPPAEDHIDEQNQALERLLAIAEDAEFESGTLVGDIRDAFLDIVKNRPKPWSQMSQQEQQDLVKVAENVSKTFIRKVVRVVAEEDTISVDGTLKGYAAKGGLFTLKIEARGDEETAHELFKMDGHSVVIMSADATRFTGQKSDAVTEPDQPDLKFSDPEKHPSDDSDLVDAAGPDLSVEEARKLVTADENAETERENVADPDAEELTAEEDANLSEPEVEAESD
jgi:hypothetical protein